MASETPVRALTPTQRRCRCESTKRTYGIARVIGSNREFATLDFRPEMKAANGLVKFKNAEQLTAKCGREPTSSRSGCSGGVKSGSRGVDVDQLLRRAFASPPPDGAYRSVWM